MGVGGAVRVALVVVAFGLLTLGVVPAVALSACSAGPSCPRAVDDSYVFTIGTSLHVPAPGVLANDAGIVGTIVDVTDSDSTSLNNATVDLHSDGSFTYTPDPTDPIAGDDSFSYDIQDPQGGTDSANVNVEVDAVVRDDGYSTPLNTTLSIPAPGVFANDDGIDTSSVTADDSSMHGAIVTVNDDGSFIYQAPQGFSGIDTFTYTVSDTNDDNDYTATVHIGVGIVAPPVSKTPNPKTIGASPSEPPPPTPTPPPRPQRTHHPSHNPAHRHAVDADLIPQCNRLARCPDASRTQWRAPRCDAPNDVNEAIRGRRINRVTTSCVDSHAAPTRRLVDTPRGGRDACDRNTGYRCRVVAPSTPHRCPDRNTRRLETQDPRCALSDRQRFARQRTAGAGRAAKKDVPVLSFRVVNGCGDTLSPRLIANRIRRVRRDRHLRAQGEMTTRQVQRVLDLSASTPPLSGANEHERSAPLATHTYTEARPRKP